MNWKIGLLTALLSSLLFANYKGTLPYVPSVNVIDTVVVPVKILKLLSITSQGGSNVYDYSGRINFDYHSGLNDSLNIALDFVPVGGGTTITPYQVSGMVGIKGFLDVNGSGGTNFIDFKCKIIGQPAAQYTARITINASKSMVEAAVDSLLGLMTQDEKILQICGTGKLAVGGGRVSTDIPRLQLPGYRMENGTQQPCGGSEGTYATAYASPSAMANSFDTALMQRVGAAIAEEYWAKSKYILEAPVTTPVLDPRVGRGYETFSEDPFLSGKIGAAYIKGSNSKLTGTSEKHFVCNDIETNRRTSSSNISERCLREIFAMPFEICIREGKSLGIMTAFNQVNGTFCAGNAHVLTDILKYDWGFTGYTLSDWGAIDPVATATAANAGQDVELITIARFGTAPMTSVLASKSVSAARLDDMARRIMRNKAYSQVIGKTFGVAYYTDKLMGAEHQAICLELGRKSIVLAKNDNSTLPLDKSTINSVALVGPWVNTIRLSGGGSGFAICQLPANVTMWQAGIAAKIGASKVINNGTWQTADAVLVFVGVNGENENADRPLLGISTSNATVADAASSTLVSQIMAAGKKCIVVFTGGTAAKKEGWANAPAIVVAWYPGESQGKALADILFGDVNPSGKLSSSWPLSESSLPPWDPTSLQHKYPSADTGVGYMWYDRTGIAPFLAFGHGLSYTTYVYNNLRVSPETGCAGEDFTVTVNIKNSGTRAGEEVAQLYISEKAPALPRPVKVLRGFARVALGAGEAKDVSFKLTPRDFAYFDDRPSGGGKFVVQPDAYTIQVGPSSINLPLKATLTLGIPN
jgi:beta-glucosidase